MDKPDTRIEYHRALLSVADIMDLYGVSRSFAYTLKKKIRWYRFGGVKFRREDVERFLELEARVVPIDGGTSSATPKGAATREPAKDHELDQELQERYGV